MGKPGIKRGPGLLADPSAPAEVWSGRRAQEYVELTLSTYGWTCWLCGLRILSRNTGTADHIIPRSKGGAVYDLRNLGPAHKRCNESRGNRDPSTYDLIEDGTAYFTEP